MALVRLILRKWKPRTTARLYENWVILILPQMDQMPLRQAFGTVTSPYNGFAAIQSSTASQTAAGTNLAIMLCPSDTFNRSPFIGSTAPSGGTSNFGSFPWARGNYGANGSLAYMSFNSPIFSQTYNGVDIAHGAAAAWNSRSYCQGVMGVNVSLRIDDIKDGASNTILVGEIRAGVTSYDPRGIWAMAGACPSSLWCHGYLTDANGPNCNMANSDDILTCTDVQNAVGARQICKRWVCLVLLAIRPIGSRPPVACTLPASTPASPTAVSTGSVISFNWERAPAASASGTS